MSAAATSFNQSSFGQWINSPAGRIFRTVAGLGFVIWGLARRGKPGGLTLLAWGLVPLSAGTFDVCYVSGALGGPLKGDQCRASRP